MNLITDQWIPVRRANGGIKRIAPWQVTEPDDPPVALAAPRPDFNGALMQLLIGLLQTTAAPESHKRWAEWLVKPPSPEELKARLEPFAGAFNLDGDGPQFMQDFAKLEGESKPIGALLIDAPGAQTLRQNADHFIKRGGMEALCPACAATALFTLQTNAPSGGAGHRTSLRGGGPLTTLVTIDPKGSRLDATLWRNLWLNVLERDTAATFTGNIAKQARSDIFPWLAETRASKSKTGRLTTPEDAHPLQMYWGAPRRIRIEWDVRSEGVCDICGEAGARVTGYLTQNYGTNYEGAWQHPLSPHYINRQSGEALPVHAQPGGLTYRHWLNLAEGTESSRLARVVQELQKDTGRKPVQVQLRLHAFGYDMDNMKARCWYEATFPLVVIPDEAVRREFSLRIETLVEAATQVAGFVQSCVKEAWFKRPGDARGDTAFLKEAFFQQTESAFYRLLEQLPEAVAERDDGELLRGWHNTLRYEALRLFDEWAVGGDLAFAEPQRIAKAHQKLQNLIHGKKLLASLGIANKKEKAV